MGNHFASAQLSQKVLWAFKGFHLDKDTADLGECVGVRTRAPGDAEGASQLLSSPVGLGYGPAVDDLDDVDLRGDALDRLFPQVAPARVVRMLQIDQPPLAFDRGNRLFRRQPAGDRLPEEESDQLALGR